MYDTSNPYDWKYYKTVVYPYGQWTLTDASLSPDNRYLAYTSIRSTVCLSPTDPGSRPEPFLLDLSDTGNHGQRGWSHMRHGFSNFGVSPGIGWFIGSRWELTRARSGAFASQVMVEN